MTLPGFLPRHDQRNITLPQLQSTQESPMGSNQALRPAVKLYVSKDETPNELARTMLINPLAYQEMSLDPEYAIYNRRLVTTAMATEDEEEVYWRVRTSVVLRHTAELPLEISGPDATALLNKVFTRDIAKNNVGRCSYQFACYEDGGMITDGILVRLEEQRYWFVQADGDLMSWLKSQSKGMDVKVFDPQIWVTQVQGPEALNVLKNALDGAYPEPFRYFDWAKVKIAGQNVIITRSGFTNELGWEFYFEDNEGAKRIGEKVLEAGVPYGMKPTSVASFRARRIEAGLMNAGSDFDDQTTPFAAGLGDMVEMDKGDFIGREALEAADKRCRTWGMKVDGGTAAAGRTITDGSQSIGNVNSTTWSPGLKCGVALVRMYSAEFGPGDNVQVHCLDGSVRKATLCETPMYDAKREIPRGKLVDIPLNFT